ncbi:hypothetical protein ABIA24_000281 [Sinorhizobium fredii]|uniref:hypothetical protein n=1 Tax=Rhizobium fredii TaxID=380 RepID=UPI0035118909
MTFNDSRGIAAWNRREHILVGQRLYSHRKLALWLAGKPATVRPAVAASLTPEAAVARWIAESDLDRLVDGDDIAESGRYMTVTERLRRLFAIAEHFAAIRDGRSVPLRRERPIGTPIKLGNDGPTAMWRALTKEIWAAMPANDSDIFPRTAKTESPRNAHLADSLALLLAWARMRQPHSLDGTNWLQADNDNYFDGEEPTPRPASNRERRMRPGSTDAELLSFIKKAGPTTEWRHAKLGSVGAVEMRPTDVDYQDVTDKSNKAGRVKKSHSVVVRAGRLRIGNGKTMQDGARVEEGTILHQEDRFGELLGSEPDPAEKVRSASYWASLFKIDRETVVETDEDGNEKLRFIKSGKMRRKVLLTEEDHRALLAGPLPPITYCKPALPRGSEDIGAQFVGSWISNPKGTRTMERWEDISDEMARQQEFERWAEALPADERKALQIASTAANFSEVGEAFGKEGKTAERYGKKILVAANDNLKKIVDAAA